ncbi:MAG: 1-(5-phosphoribosyl)-5-[(5-phosphoribosylamino)methylideneamino]imidazole-4-carboxamide isomerase [Selenomonadaceae bacterium]|nr:1-(5-phosphoribosyl)-5-[(5-phosphoribosylamino)methylideneamino]imidazole-4-carboxamide isomerase [Selenomonadaceae bacterium]
MIIFPAIDLLGGKCVRLIQGDYAKETVYSEQPGATAEKWQSMGAKFLHVVDLDGAKAGTPKNLEAIKKILESVTIPIEVGGGIRTIDDAEKLLSMGVRQIILGSIAVEKIALVEEMIKRYGDRVVVGIDARDGFVAVHGWEKNSAVKVEDLAKKMTAVGVKTIIYTDISKDGMLSGINAEVYAELAKSSGAKVVASGGIRSLDDIVALKAKENDGVIGAIVGKSIYTGALDLSAAIKVAEG